MHHLGTIKVEHMLLECGQRIFLDFFLLIYMIFKNCWQDLNVLPAIGNKSLCQICKNQDRSHLPRKKAACCDLVSALTRAFFFTEQVVLCGLYTSPDGFSHGGGGAETEFADTDYAL